MKHNIFEFVFFSSEKMLPKWIIAIFKFYSLWGFHSMPYLRIGENHIKIFILIIHIVLCIWCTINVLNTFSKLLAFFEFIDALNVYVYSTVCAFTHCLIIYDSIANQKAQNAFGQMILVSFERYSTKISIPKRCYLTTLLFITISSFTFSISSIVFDKKHLSDFATKFIYYIYLNMFDCRMFFYLLHLKVIAFKLRTIETKLKKSNLNDTQLKWCRDNYRLTNEMCNILNEIFGWSHLILILLCFQSSITLLNSVYSQIQKKYLDVHQGELTLKLTIHKFQTSDIFS